MFSNQYQGNLSQTRVANRAQMSLGSPNRQGPYTRLQTNSLPREPPVNAKMNQMDDFKDDVDYSFSHLPVRERKKLFQNLGNQDSEFMRGRQTAPKPRRSNNETQSDFGMTEYYKPTTVNSWSNATPLSGGWVSGQNGNSPPRMNNQDHHIRSQSMHTSSTRIVPQHQKSRTLDSAINRLDNLEHNIQSQYQSSWNSHPSNDIMTQSAYNSSSNQQYPMYQRQISGPGTRVIPAKTSHDLNYSSYYSQPQPLKVNVYNSDTYGTVSRNSRNVNCASTPFVVYPAYPAYRQNGNPSPIRTVPINLSSYSAPNSAHHSPSGSTIWHHPRGQYRTSYYQPQEQYERAVSYSYPRYHYEPHSYILNHQHPSNSLPLPIQSIQIPLISSNAHAYYPTRSNSYQPACSYSSSYSKSHYPSNVYPTHRSYTNPSIITHSPSTLYIPQNSYSHQQSSRMAAPPRHTSYVPSFGTGTVSIPARNTSKMQHLSVQNPIRPKWISNDSTRNTPRNTPVPSSPSPIRPGGRAFFDEEAGVSEF